jgi:hypothetical protein
VEDGITGSIVEIGQSWRVAMERLDELDRRLVRSAAERRFSSRRMAEDYLRVYASAIAGEVLPDQAPIR